MAYFFAAVGVDLDQFRLSPLLSASVQSPSPSAFTLSLPSQMTLVQGFGFTFGAGGLPSGGTVQRLVGALPTEQLVYDLFSFSVSVADFLAVAASGDDEGARRLLFSAPDTFEGSAADDRLRGYAGVDTITGGAGADFLDGGADGDRVLGGLGGDTIVDVSGVNFLRGEDGDDQIFGGFDFDDMHGNMGADTLQGGAGDDWTVGGQGNDRLFGEDGGDLVYGNLGDDTCSGGEGNDIVRGGQGFDSLSGGGGADVIAGDRGDDTLAGGAGADLFLSFGEAGLDRVVDFSVIEGDRVQLDPGSTFTMMQVGADTVLTIGGGAQMVLVGVAMSSLTAGVIYVA